MLTPINLGEQVIRVSYDLFNFFILGLYLFEGRLAIKFWQQQLFKKTTVAKFIEI